MKAVRETDTFDTFFESSWYYFRYCNARSDKPFDKEDINTHLIDKLLSPSTFIIFLKESIFLLTLKILFT